METTDLILVEQFCSNCNINFSFIDNLTEYGIVEIIELHEKKYVTSSQLKIIERAIHFHDDLHINLEGIDVIHNLLSKINDLQEELRITKNKLSLYK